MNSLQELKSSLNHKLLNNTSLPITSSEMDNYTYSNIGSHPKMEVNESNIPFKKSKYTSEKCNEARQELDTSVLCPLTGNFVIPNSKSDSERKIVGEDDYSYIEVLTGEDLDDKIENEGKGKQVANAINQKTVSASDQSTKTALPDHSESTTEGDVVPKVQEIACVEVEILERKPECKNVTCNRLNGRETNNNGIPNKEENVGLSTSVTTKDPKLPDATTSLPDNAQFQKDDVKFENNHDYTANSPICSVSEECGTKSMPPGVHHHESFSVKYPCSICNDIVGQPIFIDRTRLKSSNSDITTPLGISSNAIKCRCTICHMHSNFREHLSQNETSPQTNDFNQLQEKLIKWLNVIKYLPTSTNGMISCPSCGIEFKDWSGLCLHLKDIIVHINLCKAIQGQYGNSSCMVDSPSTSSIPKSSCTEGSQMYGNISGVVCIPHSPSTPVTSNSKAYATCEKDSSPSFLALMTSSSKASTTCDKGSSVVAMPLLCNDTPTKTKLQTNVTCEKGFSIISLEQRIERHMTSKSTATKTCDKGSSIVALPLPTSTPVTEFAKATPYDVGNGRGMVALSGPCVPPITSHHTTPTTSSAEASRTYDSDSRLLALLLSPTATPTTSFADTSGACHRDSSMMQVPNNCGTSSPLASFAEINGISESHSVIDSNLLTKAHRLITHHGNIDFPDPSAAIERWRMLPDLGGMVLHGKENDLILDRQDRGGKMKIKCAYKSIKHDSASKHGLCIQCMQHDMLWKILYIFRSIQVPITCINGCSFELYILAIAKRARGPSQSKCCPFCKLDCKEEDYLKCHLQACIKHMWTCRAVALNLFDMCQKFEFVKRAKENPLLLRSDIEVYVNDIDLPIYKLNVPDVEWIRKYLISTYLSVDFDKLGTAEDTQCLEERRPSSLLLSQTSDNAKVCDRKRSVCVENEDHVELRFLDVLLMERFNQIDVVKEAFSICELCGVTFPAQDLSLHYVTHRSSECLCEQHHLFWLLDLIFKQQENEPIQENSLLETDSIGFFKFLHHVVFDVIAFKHSICPFCYMDFRSHLLLLCHLLKCSNHVAHCNRKSNKLVSEEFSKQLSLNFELMHQTGKCVKMPQSFKLSDLEAAFSLPWKKPLH